MRRAPIPSACGYLPSTNGTGLNFRYNNAFRTVTAVSYRPIVASLGAPNPTAAILPQFPKLWINEIQPNNVTGVTDNAGDRDPWVELYNSGTTAIDLTGWHLSTITNLTRWAFPAGTSVAPGQFLIVWLDGEPAESNGSALHTSFRVSPTTGSLALVFPLETALRFSITSTTPWSVNAPSATSRMVSSGRATASSSPRRARPTTTPPPRCPCSSTNGWLRTRPLLRTRRRRLRRLVRALQPQRCCGEPHRVCTFDALAPGGPRWSVPAGTTIPARGFLLVWADNETGQNATNRADLHANFQLRQAGEEIGLFAPNGNIADSVTFGNQTNNISEGRWRDGAQDIYFMPTLHPARCECRSLHTPGGHRNSKRRFQWERRFRDYLERRAGDFLPHPI